MLILVVSTVATFVTCQHCDVSTDETRKSYWNWEHARRGRRYNWNGFNTKFVFVL